MKVLIVDPDKAGTHILEALLEGEGHSFESASSYEAASEKISLYEYDCVLLNTGLSDGKSFQLLEELNRLNKSEGIIILSVDHSPEQRVKALDAGADDYVTIPFYAEELNARIKAVVRRKKFNAKSILYFANLRIDFHQKTIQVWDHPVVLTRKEFELLLYFISNKEKTVSKTMLSDYLWGEQTDHPDSDNVLVAHIKNLRKKLNAAKAELEIKNIYGVGYQIIEL